MVKSSVSLLVLVALSTPVTKIVSQVAYVGIVEQDDGESQCSAVRVGRKHPYFLTVNHCATGKQTTIGTYPATISWRDPDETPVGLAILTTTEQDITFKPMELADVPHVGDIVTLYGYPMGSREIVFSPGAILGLGVAPLDGDDIKVSHFAVHGGYGMSGGAYVDKHGKLVSVLVGSYHEPMNWITIGADVEHVQEVVKAWRDK
jgi:S1-C subfamily serine protease